MLDKSYLHDLGLNMKKMMKEEFTAGCDINLKQEKIRLLYQQIKNNLKSAEHAQPL